ETLEPRLHLTTAPTFATAPVDIELPDDTRRYTVGIDGFDADDDDLILTVESDDPNLDVFVPQGNDFARMIFVEEDETTPIGEIVYELFGGRMPDNVERFVTLSTTGFDEDGDVDPDADPFWTLVPIHRVVPDFVIQSGDAQNGDGTGSSPLGTFDGQVDPDVLNFAAPGVLAYANRGSDPSTSDSQYFHTAVPTTFLDDTFAIIGQMTSGQEVFDDVISRERDASDRPIDTPLVERIEIFSGGQDGSMTLTANEDFDGRAELTITLEDPTGRQVVSTINIVQLGARPTIEAPATIDLEPGGTETFDVTVTDDQDQPLDVAITTEQPNVNISVEENLDAGSTPTLTGNTWRAIEMPYQIRPATVLEFDFSSAAEGDLHSIGFDVNAVHNGLQPVFEIRFELYGTEVGNETGEGNQDFRDYADTAPAVKHYTIRVGDFFTGSFNFMTFGNEHDVDDPTAESVFSNVMLYDDTPDEAIDFRDFDVVSYGPNQDVSRAFEVNDASHVATVELLDDEHVLFDVSVTAIESAIADLDLEPGMQTVSVSTLGDRPEIEDPGEQRGQPGETISFFAAITDDSGAPLDVTIDVGDQPVDATVDPDTFEVSIELPGDDQFFFDATISAVETGFDGLTPTTSIFTVNSFGDRPVIDVPDSLPIALDQPTTLAAVITDDSDLPLAVTATSSDPGIFVEVDPDTLELTFTPVDRNFHLATVTITASEDHPASPAESRQVVNVITGAGVFEQEPGDNATHSAIEGARLYIANGAAGLKVYDATDPLAPVLLGTFDEIEAHRVVPMGDHVVIAARGDGTVILDVTDPAAITRVTTLETENESRNMLIEGSLMYVAQGSAGLTAYDVTDLTSPVMLGELDNAALGTTFGLALNGRHLYVGDARSKGGVEVVDVSDPTNLRHLRTVYRDGTPREIEVSDGVLYVIDDNRDRFVLFNVRSSGNPRFINEIFIGETPQRFTITGNTAIVNNDNGFRFVDITDPERMFIDRDFDATRGQDPLVTDDAILLPFRSGGQVGVLGLDALESRMVVPRRHVYLNENGEKVTVALSGPGFMVIEHGPDGRLTRLEIRETEPRSALRITTRDDTTTIGDIVISGFLRRISAPKVDLVGELSSTRSVLSVHFDDIVDAIIDVGRHFDIRKSMKVRADQVTDLQLNSLMRLKQVKVNNWEDVDEILDFIQAPSIESLDVKNDMEADLFLSGPILRGRSTLHRARIGGTLREAEWNLGGETLNLDFRGNVEDSTIAVFVTNAFFGFLRRATFHQDVVRSQIIFATPAVAELPNLRVNATLRIKGFMRESQIRTDGHLTGTTIGGMIDSEILAGVVDEFERGLPRTFLDFKPDRARIDRVSVVGVRGEPFAVVNSSIAAWEIRQLRLFDVRNDNGGEEFGVAAHTLINLVQPDVDDPAEGIGGGGPGNDSVLRPI
ncbi:MAG: hypothetical protein CMJ18_05790, partial [Phycisphaeraceae bacterium]|nr:hypothetical protein [Phycisphaeraceae bacterium]